MRRFLSHRHLIRNNIYTEIDRTLSLLNFVFVFATQNIHYKIHNRWIRFFSTSISVCIVCWCSIRDAMWIFVVVAFFSPLYNIFALFVLFIYLFGYIQQLFFISSAHTHTYAQRIHHLHGTYAHKHTDRHTTMYTYSVMTRRCIFARLSSRFSLFVVHNTNTYAVRFVLHVHTIYAAYTAFYIEKK